MKWKDLPKTKVATLLGIHRNTVKPMLDRGELAGLTFPDVLRYAELRGLARGRAQVKAEVANLAD